MSAPALSINADLRLVVDGTHATVRADGRRMTVRTDNAGRLIAAALESVRAVPNAGGTTGDLTREAIRISRVLDDSGLSARIVGSHGTVFDIGRGSRSLPARLMLGDSPITPGSTSALLWTAAEFAGAMVKGRPARYASVATAAVALVTVGILRGRRASKPTASQ